MEFIKLILSPYGTHSYKDASNIEMNILGLFLTDDVGYYPSSFKEWGFFKNASKLFSLVKH